MIKSQEALLGEVTELLTKLFSSCLEVEKAVLYGSRAKGNYSERSDFDIAVYGQSLDRHIVARLNMEADDSSIAQKIEIQSVHEIKNAKLLEHIERVGVVVYERSNNYRNNEPR